MLDVAKRIHLTNHSHHATRRSYLEPGETRPLAEDARKGLYELRPENDDDCAFGRSCDIRCLLGRGPCERPRLSFIDGLNASTPRRSFRPHRRKSLLGSKREQLQEDEFLSSALVKVSAGILLPARQTVLMANKAEQATGYSGHYFSLSSVGCWVPGGCKARLPAL